MSLEITDTYRGIINNIEHYIYCGLCNGIPTKWITKTEWDFKINVRFNKEKNDIEYTDSNGNEINVFEEDDIEYKCY